MIVPHYYENPEVLHENTMPPRAYYIPASERREDLVEHRERSDRFQLLNGEWKFRYYNSIYDVTDAFYEENFAASEFDRMAVPGVWQMAGYDRHQYTNIRYPFPFDPPYVPQDIPCGAYVHTFVYEKEAHAPKAFLNFEGVDSCFYVWLNGVYIGYSQVSHATSEFDVSSVIRQGENRIAVLVLKWCDGSYLEDQDKFRMTGIFRDVYLLKRPENAVSDYRITTQLKKDHAVVRVELQVTNPVETKITIEDREGAVAASGELAADGCLELTVGHPVLWNTEQPYLYKIIFTTPEEVIVDRIGFRTIEIRDAVIYLNGQKIRFRGVNRHDADPETGSVSSVAQIKTDLTLMKQHNFNAIRSSHYPNAPYFYQMCDAYGFMVIDEADLEAHGPYLLYRKEDTEQNRFHRWNEAIADDPAWEKAIVDRVQLMVQREKNRPCIVIWSMGNESAYGCNFETALAWTKSFDPTRITQYESARYRNYDVTYHYDHLDLYSRMYPSLDEIKDYLKWDGSKPFLLVEYCHSMGNGPGDLEDYFQMIYKDDRMCGGFVWEWCDHAIAHGTTENGTTRYYYGGDHGEVLHDSNFCMDGLVYPDRTPHTGLREYKNVYRPVRVVSYDQKKGELLLHNYMEFDRLEDYVEISYELTQDGCILDKGMISNVHANPHEETTAKLKLSIPTEGRIYVTFFYYLKKEIPLLEQGMLLGFDEIKLENDNGKNQIAEAWLKRGGDAAGNLFVRESDKELTIQGTDFSYTLDKRTGMFTRLQYGGRDYLNHPMELNLWRAPTDNDMYCRQEWKKARYDAAYTRVYAIKIRKDQPDVVIQEHLGVVADAVQKILDVELIWTISKGGRISASMQVKKDEEFPDLPRFGIRLFLDKKMDEICYFGMGPQESYRDKHQGASHGRYHNKVRDMQEDYIRPQENGSHYDCDYVEVSTGEYGITAVAEQTFSFQASFYRQEELERAAHNYELQESDSTILCIDYAMNGIGSNSCGPEVLEAYRFDDVRFSFGFVLVPFGEERKM